MNTKQMFASTIHRLLQLPAAACTVSIKEKELHAILGGFLQVWWAAAVQRCSCFTVLRGSVQYGGWCPAPRLFVSLGLPGTCTNHNQGSGLQSTVGRALATASCPRLHQRLPAYHEHLRVASEQTALTDAYSHLMGISAGAVCDSRVAVLTICNTQVTFKRHKTTALKDLIKFYWFYFFNF